jgi:hypothetical protein
MRERSSSDDLALRALLYSSGELEGAEAAAFEERLAVDQAARDALAQVAQLSLLASGCSPVPSPSWREAARRRLHPHATVWQRILGRRVYRGHPVAWSILGAVAATVVFTLFAPSRPTSHASVPPAPELAPVDALNADADAPPPEVANAWAELRSGDHLARAHDEAARRKDRRLAHSDERRTSRFANPVPRPH